MEANSIGNILDEHFVPFLLDFDGGVGIAESRRVDQEAKGLFIRAYSVEVESLSFACLFRSFSGFCSTNLKIVNDG